MSICLWSAYIPAIHITYEEIQPFGYENQLVENSIRHALTPQPGEIFFNTMRYRSSETV